MFFGIFQTDQSSALFAATCPSPTWPQVQPPKRKKEPQSSFLSQNNVGLEIGPAFSTRYNTLQRIVSPARRRWVLVQAINACRACSAQPAKVIHSAAELSTKNL
jgi:hypothetical protein